MARRVGAPLALGDQHQDAETGDAETGDAETGAAFPPG
jgi:hypothetical protein